MISRELTRLLLFSENLPDFAKCLYSSPWPATLFDKLILCEGHTRKLEHEEDTFRIVKPAIKS